MVNDYRQLHRWSRWSTKKFESIRRFVNERFYSMSILSIFGHYLESPGSPWIFAGLQIFAEYMVGSDSPVVGGVLQLELLIYILRTNLAAVTDAVGCASDCATWLSSSEIAKAHTDTSVCAILTCWAISSLCKSFVNLEASSGVEALFETCFVCLMVDWWCCSCQWCCEENSEACDHWGLHVDGCWVSWRSWSCCCEW